MVFPEKGFNANNYFAYNFLSKAIWLKNIRPVTEWKTNNYTFTSLLIAPANKSKVELNEENVDITLLKAGLGTCILPLLP